jgi:hypothetical protein
MTFDPHDLTIISGSKRTLSHEATPQAHGNEKEGHALPTLRSKNALLLFPITAFTVYWRRTKRLL